VENKILEQHIDTDSTSFNIYIITSNDNKSINFRFVRNKKMSILKIITTAIIITLSLCLCMGRIIYTVNFT